ncbi:MAG: hypothetical protein ACXWUG_06510 [Polyangiales bacterium]
MRTLRPFAVPSAAAVLCACANLLSYDDYHAREAPTAETSVTDVAVDTAEEAETSVDLGARPPARPAGAIKPSGKGKTIWVVVNHFYLGQRDFSSDTPSTTAWKTLGYDIDHVCTSLEDAKANIGTCLRAPKASQSVLLDGDGCRDNNFGSQIVPLVSLVDGEFEKTSNAAVMNGVNTWLLELEDLDDDKDDPYVMGKFYKAATWAGYPGTHPNFDGTDVREVDAESVVDMNIDKPRALFNQGYLVNDVFVSGEPGAFEVTLPIQGISVTLPLSGGVMVLKLDRDHTNGQLGTIAGGIAQEKIAGVLGPIADAAGVCPGDALYSGLFNAIDNSMDLVIDAPNMQNPKVPCNAMSIGVGFTTVPVQPSTTVVPTPPRAMRCTMASDGGAG